MNSCFSDDGKLFATIEKKCAPIVVTCSANTFYALSRFSRHRRIATEGSLD